MKTAVLFIAAPFAIGYGCIVAQSDMTSGPLPPETEFSRVDPGFFPRQPFAALASVEQTAPPVPPRAIVTPVPVLTIDAKISQPSRPAR